MPQRPQVISTPHRIKKLSQKEYDRRRPGRARRGYNANHYKLRKIKLANNPICENDDCNKPSVDMHHIDGNTSNLDWDNLQMLCHECHSSRTMRENFGRGRAG